MAIRRCPYCKAIIDEGAEYCSNCGTQLLFPEDEYVHEEVPGEKMVEEEDSEEENLKERKSSSRKRKKEKEQQELEGVEIEEEVPQPSEDKRDEYFVEKQEPAFSTEDLEKVIDPEEKEKAEIEKFLKSLKEDRDEWNGEIPPTDELPPWAEKIKDEKPERVPAIDTESEKEVQEFEESQEPSVEVEQPVEEEIVAEEEIKEEEAEIKGAEEEIEGAEEEIVEIEEEVLEPTGVTPEDEVPDVKIPADEFAEEETVEEKLSEEEYPEKEPTISDTGMGLPEGVEQEALPFAEDSSAIFSAEEKQPPSKLSIWLKSRAFDVLFIAALWIVTLHIASRMLSTNLFKLISVSVFSVTAFYLSLLAVYLFLFFLFLGQTLGDHLFPHEE